MATDPDRAIAELRRLVDADPNDNRARLRLGDLQVRAGEPAAAVMTYRAAAEQYAGGGFLLKAIAIERQIREIITTQGLALADVYLQTTEKLAAHYEALGLTADAEAMLAELHTLRSTGRPYR
jgi:lipopolysaccharide biosynthesis regulator YciM